MARSCVRGNGRIARCGIEVPEAPLECSAPRGGSSFEFFKHMHSFGKDCDMLEIGHESKHIEPAFEFFTRMCGQPPRLRTAPGAPHALSHEDRSDLLEANKIPSSDHWWAFFSREPRYTVLCQKPFFFFVQDSNHSGLGTFGAFPRIFDAV